MAFLMFWIIKMVEWNKIEWIMDSETIELIGAKLAIIWCGDPVKAKHQNSFGQPPSGNQNLLITS